MALFHGANALKDVLGGETAFLEIPVDRSRDSGQEYGILLIEFGVLVTVSSTMVAIFYSFIGRGR